MAQLKQKATEAAEQLQTAVSAAAGKNAERIIVLDVSQTLAITDHFLICSGNSERQVHAIADAVERGLRDEWSIKPLRREGHRESRWVILDYGDFLVHAVPTARNVIITTSSACGLMLRCSTCNTKKTDNGRLDDRRRTD